MSIARYAHKAATLPDGRVLIAGGHTVSGSLTSMTASTEIYDPATRSFSLTGSLATARGEHAIAKLSDGRILVVGGLGQVGGNPLNLNSAEIYDMATGSWTPTGTMSVARRAPAALPLPDGRVLVVGGDSTISSTEIFDPSTGMFTASGSLATARGNFASAVLPDGRVLVIGGLLYSGSYSSSVEIWNPSTGTWSATGSLIYPRAYASATVLNDGRVLVAGGYNASGFPAASEIYDPNTETFSRSGNLNTPRISHVATKLADGNVAIEGGTASNWVMDKTIEIFDVATGTWRSATSVLTVRGSTSAELLASGGVLYAGGSPGPTATAEIFNPACLVSNQLNPASQTFPGSGGNGSVYVNIPAGCFWSVSFAPSWVTITSPSSGVGSGTVTYTVAPASSARSATLRIADSNFSISQSASCDTSYVPSLSPASQSVGSGSGSGSFYLSHSAGCSWTITGVPSWMTITSAMSGQGSANIYYAYSANAGSARTGTLSVAGKTFTLNQSGAAQVCPAGAVSSISPSSQSFTSAGGTGSISVSYDAGCSWSVTNVPSWISITSGASGTGNGTVNYSVAANSGAARSATLSVDNKAFTVSQTAPASGGNVCDPVALSTGVAISGNLSTSDCRSSARGTSYYTDRYSFTANPGQQIAVQLSSSAFDTYIYLKNPSGTVIASNDDSGGTTNSRIPMNSGYFTLPAGVSGTYVIEVTSYYQFATGAYTLQRLQ